MTIDDMDGVRARLDESLGSEGLLTAFRPLRADLRALLDDHARLAAEVERLRAEVDALVHEGTPDAVAHLTTRAVRAEEDVERLTRERDEARKTNLAIAPLVAEHLEADLASMRDGRDRLAAALAEARSPCCNAAIRCGRCGGDTRVIGDAALATHDARVRAEAIAEVTRAVEHRGPAILVVASDVQSVIDAVDDHHDRVRAGALREAAEHIAAWGYEHGGSRAEAGAWLRSEADRIERGGR